MLSTIEKLNKKIEEENEKPHLTFLVVDEMRGDKGCRPEGYDPTTDDRDVNPPIVVVKGLEDFAKHKFFCCHLDPAEPLD